MNIKHLSIGVLSAVGILLATVSGALAQAPIFAETWVSGTVYGSDGNPVNGGSVVVNCGSGSAAATITSTGTYAVSFSQSVCKAGNTVSGSASTSEGSGSNSETVQNTAVNGPVVDLDIAVVDITVPEFGLIGGVMTAIGASAGYLVLRAKQMV